MGSAKDSFSGYPIVSLCYVSLRCCCIPVTGLPEDERGKNEVYFKTRLRRFVSYFYDSANAVSADPQEDTRVILCVY